MARDGRKRTRVPPRRRYRFGYTAVPVEREDEAAWLAEQIEIERRNAERIPPPGGGGVAKAKWS